MHVEYEWRLKHEDLDESDEDLEEKVLPVTHPATHQGVEFTPKCKEWIEKCHCVIELIFRCFWNDNNALPRQHQLPPSPFNPYPGTPQPHYITLDLGIFHNVHILYHDSAPNFPKFNTSQGQ